MATATFPELDEIELTIVQPEEDYEVVGGRIVEEPPLGLYETRMAFDLAVSITFFDPSKRLGEVVPDGLFILRHEPTLRRRPDVAFVSTERWPVDRPPVREAAWDVIPDLAVEFTSPTDLIDDLMDKVDEYFAAGVRLVWVVYPKQRKLYAYQSPKSVAILGDGDMLEGGAVLPGFRISLTDLFELRRGKPTPIA